MLVLKIIKCYYFNFNVVVVIKKRKEKVDLNVEEIVLHQALVVIDQHQRKDVR